MSNYAQQSLFEDDFRADRAATTEAVDARSGTFTDNLRLPIHRWFRYSAGFSAEWAKTLVVPGKVVLDPFAGSGTTLLAAQQVGAESFGFESHPFVHRIAQAKLAWSSVNTSELLGFTQEIITKAKNVVELPPKAGPLLDKCYTPHALFKLLALRDSFLGAKAAASEPVREIAWLAITSILRACSHVGTAQWQYVLPNKRKASVPEPYSVFELRLREMIDDVHRSRSSGTAAPATILLHDARELAPLRPNSVDIVITSPPYANNYDYADATRLEMTFWGEISGWADLQGTVRRHMVRSCSQHTAAERLVLSDLLSCETVAPIVDELRPVCEELERVRETKGGKKTYHTMIAAYFSDMSRILSALRSLCKPGSVLCFVIGDSAPYGVHAPAERWLGQLALHAGFKSHEFEKIRDRNVKWKNRKHTVPLQEGRLWITG